MSVRPLAYTYTVHGRCLACGQFSELLDLRSRVCGSCNARDDHRAKHLRGLRRTARLSRLGRRVVAIVLAVGALGATSALITTALAGGIHP
jgi:hypothetical protein